MRELPELPHGKHVVKRETDMLKILLTFYQDLQRISLPEAEDYREVSLGYYLHVFWKRKWLVVLPLLFIMPFIFSDIMTQKPAYVATATVLIEDTSPKVLVVTEVSVPDKEPSFHNTQYEILKSRAIVEEVVDRLHLDARDSKPDSPLVATLKTIKHFPLRLPDMLIGGVTALVTGGTDSVSSHADDTVAETMSPSPEWSHRQRVIEDLQNAFKVEPRPETKLVDIILTGDNPAEVAEQVNTIAEVYVQQNLETKLDASRKAAAWLSKEAQLLRETIRQAEQQLQSYKEEKQIVASATGNTSGGPDAQALTKLQLAYDDKKRERILLRSEINALRKLARGDLNDPMFLDDTVLNSLRKQIIELQSEYRTLSKSLDLKHPRIVSLNSQIDTIQKAIEKEIKRTITNIENKYNAVVSQENELRLLWNTQKKSLIQTDKDVTEYEEFKRDLEIQKNMYSEIRKRLAETTLTAALATNNVQLVERAIRGTPVSSMAIIKLLVSIMLGLGCGGGLALLAEYRDRRFKDAREVEQYLGLPFLGFIPHHKVSKRSTPCLIALQEPWSLASEAYRSLRTWVQLSESPVKTLLIASAFPGEGKSTTAANLAVSFAQLGHRVLLVDVDLRRSGIHRVFGLANTKGLADLLRHSLEWQSLLQDSRLENLKVLTAGSRPFNPTELLSTTRMQQSIESWKEHFDTIIFDSPIALWIPDVAVLAPAMDGVLLIHYPARGNRDALLEAKRNLERARARLLGVVFNNVSSKEEKYYYTYPSRYTYYYDPPPPSPSTYDGVGVPPSLERGGDKPRFLSP